MRNTTSTWRAIAKLARDRGESMVSVPTEGIERLVEHLQELDRVFIAAESFVACTGEYVHGFRWTKDEAEGLAYLAQALKAVQS